MYELSTTSSGKPILYVEFSGVEIELLLEKISRCQIDGKTITFFDPVGKRLCKISRSMKKIAMLTEPYGFHRFCVKHCMNPAFIESYQKAGSGNHFLIMKCGTRLEIPEEK